MCADATFALCLHSHYFLILRDVYWNTAAENRDGKDRDLEKNAGVLQMERNSVSPKATSNTSGASPAKPEDFDAPSLRSESGRLGEAIVGAFRDATGALAHATQHETPVRICACIVSLFFDLKQRTHIGRRAARNEVGRCGDARNCGSA